MSKPLGDNATSCSFGAANSSPGSAPRSRNIALPLVVLALTGSPAQAGRSRGIRGLVYVVWAIPAGVLIDRWDRRHVMVVANLGSGCAMGSVALALYFDRLSLAQLFIASAVEGSFFVFANLGRFAALPNVVSKEQFPAAAAQTGTADQIARLVGPPRAVSSTRRSAASLSPSRSIRSPTQSTPSRSSPSTRPYVRQRGPGNRRSAGHCATRLPPGWLALATTSPPLPQPAHRRVAPWSPPGSTC